MPCRRADGVVGAAVVMEISRSPARRLASFVAALLAAACSPSSNPGGSNVLRPTVSFETGSRSGVSEPSATPPDVGWQRHGRTDDEQRYSPLARIDEKNVASLGLAWSFDLETTHGVEATPLVIGDAMYVTGPWSVIEPRIASVARTPGVV